MFGTAPALHVRSPPTYRNSHLVATRSRPSLGSPRTIGGPSQLSAHNLPFLPSFSTGVVSRLAPRYRAPNTYGSSSLVSSPAPYGLVSRGFSGLVSSGFSRGPALVPSTPPVAFERYARVQEEATPGSVGDLQHDQSNPTSPSPGGASPLSSRCKPTKYKVEICRHFSSTGNCPFGARCTYAHGEKDLMPRTLVDLDELQLVDKETYRCHPCFDHIATGHW